MNIEIKSVPFSWNDNLSEIAIEDFQQIQKNLPYVMCQSIGMALAKLELLEKQECKVDEEVNAIEIPNGATNGDMIKAMFPNEIVDEIRGHFEGHLLGYRTWLGGRSQEFLLDWWNSPYKRG